MDGIPLPAPLKPILAELGVDWPQMKELAIIPKAIEYFMFTKGATTASLQISSSIAQLLESNTSPGLSAFQERMTTISGVNGYCARAAASSVLAGYSLSVGVEAMVSYKVLTLETVAKVAVVRMKAMTDNRMDEYYAYRAAVSVAMQQVQAGLKQTLDMIDELGAKPAATLLEGGVEHLRDRDLHKSKEGVKKYTTKEKREANAEEYERRWEELTHDPATGGGVTDETRREATVAMGLEAAGKFPAGSVQRAPTGDDDFLVVIKGEKPQPWDIKGFVSGDPELNPKVNAKGAYDDEKATASIEGELIQGVNVVVDMSRMNERDRLALQLLIRKNPSWQGRVVVY